MPVAQTDGSAAALPAELFQKIKEIQIRTQRMVDDVFAGEYETAFKGRGNPATTSGTSTGTSRRAWAAPLSRCTAKSASSP
jgi:hypothetical protein